MLNGSGASLLILNQKNSKSRRLCPEKETWWRRITPGIEPYLLSICGFRFSVEQMLKLDLLSLENYNEMTNLHSVIFLRGNQPIREAAMQTLPGNLMLLASIKSSSGPWAFMELFQFFPSLPSTPFIFVFLPYYHPAPRKKQEQITFSKQDSDNLLEAGMTKVILCS